MYYKKFPIAVHLKMEVHMKMMLKKQMKNSTPQKDSTHGNIQCIFDGSTPTNSHTATMDMSSQTDITSETFEMKEKKRVIGPKTFQEKCIDTLLNVMLITKLVSML